MGWSRQDEQYMQRALHLAAMGQGGVAPNPMVGAVLVRGETIVAEGFHAAFGGVHAERAALEHAQQVGVDTQGATLYVSLEPCNHEGKTPPCTEAIIAAGLARVVVAVLDPNPAVSGRGAARLREAGIQVEVGLLEAQARHLNRRFFIFHEKRRPYVILKWAQTLDGFVDSERQPDEAPQWLTNQESRLLVHKWRTEEMAILTGTNTIARDNPQLTVRHWGGRNPLRVVLDRTMRLSPQAHVFDGSTPTLVFAGKNLRAAQLGSTLSEKPALELLQVDFMKGIERLVLGTLYERNVLSLIVEGGTLLLTNFMKQNLWDEARVFIGNQYFYRGVRGPELPDTPCGKTMLGNVTLTRFVNPHADSLA